MSPELTYLYLIAVGLLLLDSVWWIELLYCVGAWVLLRQARRDAGT